MANSQCNTVDAKFDEQVVLTTIVDAMLDARSDLESAPLERWTDILVKSCRRKKDFGPAPTSSSSQVAV